jgi:hypothetical protein
VTENRHHVFSGATRGRRIRMLVVACAAVVISGCAAYGSIIGPPRHGVQARPISVPEGHLPPPGECRIWFPDRAAGQQPPPGDCAELRQRLPANARLIRG